jgi:hypothetical protein
MHRFSSLRAVRRSALATLTLLLASTVTLAYVPPGGSSNNPTSETYDGVCSASNGATLDREPTSLCSVGRDSSLSVNNGKWTWSCYGADGGRDASCSATIATGGACGHSDGVEYTWQPTDRLCTNSTASAITAHADFGPWSWTCTGSGTGTPASCSTKANGACGSSSGVAFTATPTTGLCTSGTASAISALSTSGPWTWSCTGADGGTTASCATLADPACGASASKYFTTFPTTDLCTTGTATASNYSDPLHWDWTCPGTAGGRAVNCSALVFKNTCSYANGKSFTTAPELDGLCYGGIPSALTGNGPWSWSCTSYNGAKVSCSTVNSIIYPTITIADKTKAVIKDVLITPQEDALGSEGAIYVAIILNGVVYMMDGSNNLTQYNAEQSPPAYFSGTLATTTLNIIPSPTDLSAYLQASLLVGVGRTFAPLSNPFQDMLNQGTYKIIYTVE